MKQILISVGTVLILASCNTSKTTEVATEEVPVTYTNTIKKLVTRKCVGCHKGYGAAGSLSLETYESVKRSAKDGELLKRINDVYKPMPKAGLMSEKNRGLFQKWADNAYAE